MKNSQYIRSRRHYTVIMWDLVTRDYSCRLTADEVFENVKRYTRNGSIITFHDSLKSIDKLKTALPRSIEWLKEQGYEFKIFDENQQKSRHLK
jgi:peptidoglycan/xylan/chitin deacetylase (PgdA/CDA1 family)